MYGKTSCQVVTFSSLTTHQHPQLVRPVTSSWAIIIINNHFHGRALFLFLHARWESLSLSLTLAIPLCYFLVAAGETPVHEGHMRGHKMKKDGELEATVFILAPNITSPKIIPLEIWVKYGSIVVGGARWFRWKDGIILECPQCLQVQQNDSKITSIAEKHHFIHLTIVAQTGIPQNKNNQKIYCTQPKSVSEIMGKLEVQTHPDSQKNQGTNPASQVNAVAVHFPSISCVASDSALLSYRGSWQWWATRCQGTPQL